MPVAKYFSDSDLMGRDVRRGKKERISDVMLPGDYSKQGEILEVQNEGCALQKKEKKEEGYLRRVLKGQYGNFFSAFGNKKLLKRFSCIYIREAVFYPAFLE